MKRLTLESETCFLEVSQHLTKHIGIFHWHNPSGRTGVDPATNRNEYQVYFLGVKAAGA
jgi:hypothetical protein